MIVIFKCGFFESNITPRIGASIPGYFEDRISTAVLDDLYAHAYAFSDGAKTIIIISLDAILISAEDVECIRKKIFDATSIPPSNILVAAIHSHTAGPVTTLYCVKRNDEYVDFLIDRAADAGIAAFEKMMPAKLGYASTDVRGVAFNRRWVMTDGKVMTNPPHCSPDIVAPADITDPQLIVVRIDHDDGTPMGIITNFALHLDCVGSCVFSADYPGTMRSIIRNEYGDNIGFMFLNGCCGNINHVDFVNGKVREHTEIGEILAAAAIDAFNTIETTDNVPVNTSCEFVTAEIRLPTAEEIANAHFHPLLAKEMELAVELGGGEVNCEVQSITLGDLAITGMPGEMFCIFGLMVKEGSPYKMNLICELANGNNGYVYTREARKLGGYEATASTYTRLNEEAGYLMTNAAIRNLRKMKQ